MKILTEQENGTMTIVKAIDSSFAIVKAIDDSLQDDDDTTINWKGERWQDENANNNSMLIIVNTAFDENAKNSDEEPEPDESDELTNAQRQTTNDEPNIVQDIELAVISVNESLNSSNEINESPIDGEEIDTSDNNTTNNTQTTAECDDRLLPIEQKHNRNGSGSSNYDDYEADENLSIGVDELRKHNGDYGIHDVQNADETHKLVNGENGSELEDCDYYSDGEPNGDAEDHTTNDILKFNGGDGIIANHFIGLYFSNSCHNFFP